MSFNAKTFEYKTAGNYLSKVNNRNTRTMREIHSKAIIKAPERRHCVAYLYPSDDFRVHRWATPWRRSVVFMTNFEQISHVVLVFLVFLLLNLNKQMPTWLVMSQPFKRQSHKMVKHTQTIRRKFADELFEFVWPFCELAFKALG